MKPDYFEFSIASHYLPALINGDYSGMDETETRLFSEWFESLDRRIQTFDCVDYGDNFKRCEVSGLFADCSTVRGYFWEL